MQGRLLCPRVLVRRARDEKGAPFEACGRQWEYGLAAEQTVWPAVGAASGSAQAVGSAFWRRAGVDARDRMDRDPGDLQDPFS
jgi:hypothetical protein